MVQQEDMSRCVRSGDRAGSRTLNLLGSAAGVGARIVCDGGSLAFAATCDKALQDSGDCFDYRLHDKAEKGDTTTIIQGLP